MSFDIYTATDEEIKAERERRYLELWPDAYAQIEYASRHGLDKIYIKKDEIRIELPYSYERGIE